MNLYFEIPSHLTKYMTTHETMIEDKLSPSEKTAASWLMGDREYKNERLKLIAYVAEGPWVVRNLVTGRPALIGKKLPVTYDLYPSTSKSEAPLMIATLDIGNSSATAKRIVSVCRRYMSALTVDIGFVIQAENENELPEQMLGSVRVHGPDPLKAPKLNPH
jgi:Protein ENHANCED DISEASE RESISTANCE 2, C-terminal